MRDVNVGIIGCGTVAESCHLPAVKEIHPIKIGALADINKEQASHLAERFGLEDVSIYSDYSELLKKSDIDAVWILTPPQLHARIIIDSLNTDKHVMCEKPLATSRSESRLIEKALEKRKEYSESTILMPAHNFLFTPSFERAQQIIEEGAIGKIKVIRGRSISNLTFYKAKTEFRARTKGGVIEDQLPHVIYLDQELAGPIEHIISVQPYQRGRSVAEDVEVVAKHKKYCESVISAAWSGFIPTFKLEIIGENGSLSMDLLRTPYNIAVTRDRVTENIQMGNRFGQYIDVLRGRHPSYFLEHLHFVDLINGEAEAKVTPESGFQLVKALERIMEVVDERQTPEGFTESATVAIVRADSNIEASVRKSVAMLGDMRIPKDAKVVIKPNVCSGRNPEGMVVTDTKLLEAVLRITKEKTDKVFVVESDNNAGDAESRLEKTGIIEIINKNGAVFVNLSRDDYEDREIAGISVRLPKTVLETDYLINLPKMKTCNIENMFISIAMKNMFGIVPDKKKVLLHKNLMEILIHINREIRQDMIIVDGQVAMEGLGPVWGQPVPLNIILSGVNPVTVDAVCCQIMGINPYAIETLWRAYKLGNGEIDIKRIEVLGEKIETVRRKFSYPVFMTKNITGAIRTALKTYL